MIDKTIMEPILEPIDKRAALLILDRIDAIRRNRGFDPVQNNDLMLRLAAAVVARSAGYLCRNDWCEDLKNLPNSEYSEYYEHLKNYTGV